MCSFIWRLLFTVNFKYGILCHSAMRRMLKIKVWVYNQILQELFWLYKERVTENVCCKSNVLRFLLRFLMQRIYWKTVLRWCLTTTVGSVGWTTHADHPWNLPKTIATKIPTKMRLVPMRFIKESFPIHLQEADKKGSKFMKQCICLR